MNELERVVLALVRNIEAKFPGYLAEPFRVQELHERIIPYREQRTALGLETNEYYELALTRLLAGEGGYLVAPEEVRNALKKELDNPHPDSGRFRKFGNADVTLSALALSVRERAQRTAGNPTAAAQQLREPAPAQKPPVAPPRAGAGEAPRTSTTTATEPVMPALQTQQTAAPPQKSASRAAGGTSPGKGKEWIMPPGQRTTTSADLGGKCRYCHGVLPDNRDLTYCPHCGQDLTVHHCPACSTELQVGWKFCVTCGRTVEE